MPPRNDPPADSGQIQVALAAGLGGLFLLLAVFLGALTGIDQQDPAACQLPPTPTRTAATAIPANYLNLYRKAGRQYRIAWNLLAAIGKAETDHGRDPGPGVHSGANYAGAAGPMQIGIGGAAGNTWGGTPRHPSRAHAGGYGTDGDGWDDVYDPADAIPTAARILKAHGAPANIHRAIYAYNHSTNYVDNILNIADHYASHGAQAIAAADDPTCEQAALGPLPANRVAANVIAYARTQLGKPYIYGATGPDAFDCSGLTMTAYRTAGITIPRLSDAQYWWGASIPPGQEQPGDLVFFDYQPGHTGPGHVGIVYNPTQATMIVAPHTGDVVKYQNYKVYPGGPVGFTRPTARNDHNGPARRS
jgi:cell wall-associated NlpC family hydrolase